ncbi:hypothetical protein EI555_016049, partial [Monodon monoceros]
MRSSEPEARMERREGNERTFPNVYNISRMSYPTYRPIFPHMHRLSSTPPYQRRLLQKSRSYIRLLCACFSGFSCVLLLCLSPLHWVRFTVLKDRQGLLAGLWTVCHHDLCWNHTLKAPCELPPILRVLLPHVAFSILIIITWLSISLTKGPGDKTYIDLGISIFCFISGTCLCFCLILFLMQVKLYSRKVSEPRFLLVYGINWWGSIFYVIVGFLSGLSHLSSQVSLPDQNLLVIPITRTRIGNIATVELSLSEANVGVSPW